MDAYAWVHMHAAVCTCMRTSGVAEAEAEVDVEVEAVLCEHQVAVVPVAQLEEPHEHRVASERLEEVLLSDQEALRVWRP